MTGNCDMFQPPASKSETPNATSFSQGEKILGAYRPCQKPQVALAPSPACHRVLLDNESRRSAQRPRRFSSCALLQGNSSACLASRKNVCVVGHTSCVKQSSISHDPFSRLIEVSAPSRWVFPLIPSHIAVRLIREQIWLRIN